MANEGSRGRLKYEFSWARLVSDFISPPVVLAVLVSMISVRYAQTSAEAFTWAVTYIVLVCVAPVLYIAWMVQRGKIGDIHMQYRHERRRPFLVSIVCTALAYVLLQQMGAAPRVSQFTLLTLIQLGIMALITLVWQISLHSMSITVAVVAVGLLYGPVSALVASPLAPLVGAARIHLRRHTLSQVLAGAAIGVLLPVLALQP